MKKLKNLVVVLLLAVIVAGCGSSDKKGATKTCSIEIMGMEIAYVLQAESEEGNITDVEMSVNMSYDALGVSADDLTDDMKEEIVSEMEAMVGVDEGMEVETDFNDDGIKVVAVMSVDALKEMSGTDEDLPLDEFVAEMETMGATCE